MKKLLNCSVSKWLVRAYVAILAFAVGGMAKADGIDITPVTSHLTAANVAIGLIVAAGVVVTVGWIIGALLKKGLHMFGKG